VKDRVKAFAGLDWEVLSMVVSALVTGLKLTSALFAGLLLPN
jgi:hypothetical protein